MEATDTSKGKEGSKVQKNSLILITLACVCLIVLLTVLIFLRYSKSNTQSRSNDVKQTNALQPISTSNIDSIKIQLLQSNNISFINLGASLGFIPVKELTNQYGFVQYNLPFYYVHLDSGQQAVLANYLYKNTQGSLLTVQDGVDLYANNWLFYIHTDGENLVVKDGFVCYVFPKDYTQPAMCSADGNCIYPTPEFGCAIVHDDFLTKDKTQKEFVNETLTKAGIDCSNCNFEERMVDVMLPEFSREEVYFGAFDAKNVALVDKELESAKRYFEDAGWSVSIKDNSEDESRWSGNYVVVASKLLEAEKDKARCSHTVTVFNEPSKTEKREMIKCSLKLEGY